jgi:hypothetical protein
MKRLKIAFGLAVVAGLMVITAAPAMAANARWEQCKKVITAKTGNWKNALCSEGQKEGEWLTMEVTETEEVTSSGEGELEDQKATGGASAFKCNGTGVGWIGTGGNGGVSQVSQKSCTRLSGLCEVGKPVTIRAVNLPWFGKLEIREGKIRGVNQTGGTGVGYKVECTVGGIFKVADECTQTKISGAVSNGSNGNVQGTFDKISEEEKGNCTLGGANSGVVRGTGSMQQRKEVATYANIR